MAHGTTFAGPVPLFTARTSMKLLHIDSSILGQQSVSRQLTAQLIEAARQQHGDVNVTYRDLALAPRPRLRLP